MHAGLGNMNLRIGVTCEYKDRSLDVYNHEYLDNFDAFI